MRPTNRAGFRRRLLLITGALLIIGGLLLTLSAPKPALVNNKADAYGAPAPVKPTSPKSKAECVNYYGANATAEARECLAQATRYGALKRCSRKRGASAQKACKKSANKAYAKARAKLAAQRKAETACSNAYRAASNQLNAEDPEYSQKSVTVGVTFRACLAKAQR
jgi:hypothetical protein